MAKAVGPTPGHRLSLPPTDEAEPEGDEVATTGTDDTPGILPTPIV